jgi:hypothetical protein
MEEEFDMSNSSSIFVQISKSLLSPKRLRAGRQMSKECQSSKRDSEIEDPELVSGQGSE